jgi:MFS family permease
MLASSVIDRGGGQIRAGLRHAWRNHDLRLSLCLIAAVGVFGFNFLVHLPVLANEQLGGSGAYTLLTSAFGLGSVVGAVHLARQRTIDVSLLVRHTALLTAAVVALAAAPGMPLAAAAAVVAGFSSMGLLSGANTIAALAGDVEMRGRVLGLFTVIVVGSIPISGPLVGGLSEAIGIRMALLLSALASGLTALAVHAASRRTPAPLRVVTEPAAGLAPAPAIHDDDTLRL